MNKEADKIPSTADAIPTPAPPENNPALSAKRPSKARKAKPKELLVDIAPSGGDGPDVGLTRPQ